MCSRYYYDWENFADLRELLNGERDKKEDLYDIPVINEEGDVLPSMKAMTVAGENRHLCARQMSWGFPGYEGSRLLINARSETALSKPTFSDSVMHRRCVIPVGRFYEWNSERNKVTFTLEGERTIWLAGCYRPDARFVILTTAANESMIRTHDRMPLTIPKDGIRDWIFDDSAVKDFLNALQPQFAGATDYEQLRFF